MILFTGAIGRAYINLYNPFLPLKDEIEALTGVNVKKIGDKSDITEIKQKSNTDNSNGNNNKNSETSGTH